MILMVLVALTAVTLLAASKIQSPQQRLADVAPPDATVLTEPVVRTTITDMVSLSGTLRYRHYTPIQVQAPGTLTRLMRKDGETIGAGDVFAEVDARPLIAVKLDYPLFRDISPGASGEDVRSLQRFLASAGYPSAPDRPGQYQKGTQQALQRFYKARGYEPPATAQASSDPTGAEAGVIATPREFLNIPELPAEVVRFHVAVGARVEGRIGELGSGGVVAVAEMPTRGAERVKPGLRVQLRVGSEVRSGRLASIGAAQPEPRPGEEAAPPAPPTATVELTEPLVSPVMGASVKLEVVVAETPGPVLGVPVAAIFEAPDGSVHVRVVRDGRGTRVPVKTGLVGGGLVEVSATDPLLREGASVEVGRSSSDEGANG